MFFGRQKCPQLRTTALPHQTDFFLFHGELLCGTSMCLLDSHFVQMLKKNCCFHVIVEVMLKYLSNCSYLKLPLIYYTYSCPETCI